MSYGQPNTAIYYIYSGHDSTLAIKLAADLKNVGFDLWVEQLDNALNNEQMAATQEKISQCRLMLPIISGNFQVTRTGTQEPSSAVRRGATPNLSTGNGGTDYEWN